MELIISLEFSTVSHFYNIKWFRIALPGEVATLKFASFTMVYGF